MPDERSIWGRLGKTILDSPDDDPPRLGFAAALEEQTDGNPFDRHNRANFIRTQVKLGRIHPGHPEWSVLSAREQVLLNRYGQEWLPNGFRQSAIAEARYFRGFISHLTVRAFASVELQDEVLQEAPVEHIDVVGIEKPFTFTATLEWLVRSGLSLRLRSLALDAQQLTDGHAKLLTTVEFPRLKWLSLTDNKIGDDGVALLMARFQNLRFVDLDGNPGDPQDGFAYDQGIVIEREPGKVPLGASESPWLHPQVRGGRVVYPSRYRMVQPRTQGQFQEI